MSGNALKGIDLHALGLDDLSDVIALQAQCYVPKFLERPAAFAAKLRATAVLQTCWIARRVADGQALAYAVSLPVCWEAFPALDDDGFALPPAPQLLYLHDLAVAPAGRGQGLAAQLLARVAERAAALGLAELGLIAVQDSAAYWRSHGFEEPAALEAALARKLASFGRDARFLLRRAARRD